VLLSVPVHESFGVFSNPGVISGWTDPPPGGSDNFGYTAYIWYDQVGANNTGWNPAPTFTSAHAPFTYNTLIKSGPQTWYVGSSSVISGGGLPVWSGTISYYRDHGTSQ
jgi:hypothetical protein